MTLDEEVLETAGQMRREPMDEADKKVMGTMCKAAVFDLMSRLRQDVSFEYIYDNFVSAAAALATALFLETEISGISGYTAGSLKLENCSPRQMKDAASALRTQAELLLMGFLNDRRFDFKAVRG